MAKKKAEGMEEVKGNIEGLDQLNAEFKSGKMQPKKLVALRTKLASLYKEEKITEEEQELMEAILRKERNHATIASAHSYLLNKIEADRIENVAVVSSDDAPAVHHLRKDMECKYIHDPDFNDGKRRSDSIGRFTVYVPRVVPTEHQLSVQTVLKEMKGHPTDPSEYPAPKILIHRIVLKEKEFQKWFEIKDDSILTPVGKKEEVFTF